MKTQIKSLLKAHKEDRESGVAMIIVLLMVVVLIGIVVTVTSLSVLGLEKGKDVQALTAGSNAADTAVSHALSLANSKKGQDGQGLEQHIGVGNAVYGSVAANVNDPAAGDGQYLWRWYAEKVTNTKNNMSYNIYATGYLNTPDDDTARSFKVTLDSAVVESAIYDVSGKVLYAPSSAGVFNWAAFATTSIDLKKDVKINTYDSARNIGYPTVSLAEGEVGTNGTMNLADGVISKYMFLDTIGTPKDRCTGTPCISQMLGIMTYGLSLKSASQIVQDACPLPNASYTDWIASQNSGTIAFNSTPKCYNNIVFDIDTDLPLTFSSGRPAIMMAKGNVTVKPGVEVNKQLSTSQGPLTLRIYSQAGTNFTMERGTVANPTKMTAVVAGPNLLCNIGKDTPYVSPHDTSLMGAMACKRAVVEQGSTVWWDTQTQQVSSEGSPNAKKLWNITDYQEI